FTIHAFTVFTNCSRPGAGSLYPSSSRPPCKKAFFPYTTLFRSGRSPVNVGVGGSTGSYGSGVGLGVGINLGGGSRPSEQIDTERSEEHTSELQSRENLVCRLLLEKKKNAQNNEMEACRPHLQAR